MIFWFGFTLYLSFRLINAYAIKYVHLNLLVQLFKLLFPIFFFVLQCNIPGFSDFGAEIIGKQHQILAIFGAKIQTLMRNIAL